jgi:IS5 family transposase
MIPKKQPRNTPFLFSDYETLLNHTNPLFILANKINWQIFEDAFLPLYSKDTGRPGKPIRMMVGLLILKHLRNISDESVVEQWSENMYFQYMCGEVRIAAGAPCEASELVYFRKRIGESGIELILKESIRINQDDAQDDDVIVDTTVQEKNITFPTDDKMFKKIIRACWKIASINGIKLRQSYKKTLKKLSLNQRFRTNPRNSSKARKADRRIKVIAGRLVRELERHLKPENKDFKRLDLFKKALAQKRNDRDKIYSLHEPHTKCISKGKEHKKYEFGNKASIAKTISGVIVGALGFRNEFDGHTLKPALEQVAKLTGKQPKHAIVDRGYRGTHQIGETTVLIPKPPTKNQSKYMSQKLREKHRSRAGIEPVIGHLKQDHRLSRNFYKGIFGDNINVMLAAAAFNFKRMMNLWKSSFGLILRVLLRYIQAEIGVFRPIISAQLSPKLLTERFENIMPQKRPFYKPELGRFNELILG